MANMSKREKARTDEEIDEVVTSEADDDSAWSEPIPVRLRQPASIALSGDLAARAAFLARIHREKSLKSWLLRVVRERIELEEGAFVEAKRDFAKSHG
jgi:hypothetical protein